jgi:murein DD-endopeptidase MepM/ murein hydrolase activator NlpD
MPFSRLGVGAAVLLVLIGFPARGPDPPARATAAIQWGWPLEGGRPEVVRGFEPPPQPWMAGHRGVDLVPAAGDVVVAAGAGVVRFAGVVVDRPVVSITHANGLVTTYEPVAPLVAAGQTVARGQAIGRMIAGHAGCVAPCLHWGLRDGSSYVDPMSLIGRARVRLLPSAGLAAPRRGARSPRRRCRSGR